MNRRFLNDMLNTGISFVMLRDGLIWNACFETTEAMTIVTFSPMSDEEFLQWLNAPKIHWSQLLDPTSFEAKGGHEL